MEFIKLKSFIKIIRISYIGTAKEKMQRRYRSSRFKTHLMLLWKKKKEENFSLLNLTQHQRDKPQRLRKIYLEEI